MNPYRVSSKKILDPAKRTTTNRIVSQVKEIISRYAVDGVHFDDYFYPQNIKKYKKVPAATRRKNVNVMVRKVYQRRNGGQERLRRNARFDLRRGVMSGDCRHVCLQTQKEVMSRP